MNTARTNRPAPLEVAGKNVGALFPRSPTTATLNRLTEEPKKCEVTATVRVCEAAEDATLVEKDGTCVLRWPFGDGAPPFRQMVGDWLSLVKTGCHGGPGGCAAAPCAAGLGSTAVLVVLALLAGSVKYKGAVQIIRQKQRGAVNSKQLVWLNKSCAEMQLHSKAPVLTETPVGSQ